MADPLLAINEALDDSDVALKKLSAICCEPGRSPRMDALAETLSKARGNLERAVVTTETAETTIPILEDAGSQLGWLQVGCCAPERLPLYERILRNLMTIQLSISESLGTGH